MIIHRPLHTFGFAALLILAGIAVAQRGFRDRWDDYQDPTEEGYRPRRDGVPDWELPKHMPDDVFTFVRVKYRSERRYGRWGRGGGWATDYPASDLNFSYRLQELTSMEVDPNGKVMELTDPRLFDYPFIYMIEPGSISLGPEEVKNLRKYLENGGFLMVDDFWGNEEWYTFYDQLKRVFPNRNLDEELTELPLKHPIFHCVFDLQEKPQVPSMHTAIRNREEGITWEWGKGEGAETVHYKQLKDEKGRMMCIVCFNTDLGDGWEREGEDAWYFKEFAEKKSYPMGINIVFYALTH